MGLASISARSQLQSAVLKCAGKSPDKSNAVVTASVYFAQAAISFSADSKARASHPVTRVINSDSKITSEASEKIEAKIQKLTKELNSISESKIISLLKLKVNFNNIKQKKIDALKKILEGKSLTIEDLKAIKHVDSFGKSESWCLLEGCGLVKTTFDANTKARYEGQWADGKRNGVGTYIYANGDRYEGQLADGLRNGVGICICANGDRYEGQWANGKGNGVGTYIYANGARYEGQWVNAQRSGWGIMIYANGDRFTGRWVQNRKSERGVIPQDILDLKNRILEQCEDALQKQAEHMQELMAQLKEAFINAHKLYLRFKSEEKLPDLKLAAEDTGLIDPLLLLVGEYDAPEFAPLLSEKFANI